MEENTKTDPPEFLRDDPDAIAEWERLVKHADTLGLIVDLDSALMAVYCQACGDLQAVIAEMRGAPMFYQAIDGRVFLDPRVRVARDLLNEIISTGRELAIREYRPRLPRRSRAELLFNFPVAKGET